MITSRLDHRGAGEVARLAEWGDAVRDAFDRPRVRLDSLELRLHSCNGSEKAESLIVRFNNRDILAPLASCPCQMC